MSETNTIDAPAFTALGTSRDRVALPATPFDGRVNGPVMHQAVKSYLANQRQGTAYTKTRGLVIGGNQKPWKQKGTGRARQGSTRAPHWPGGGTVFGPHGDRNYNEKLPRQVRALARSSALNARALSGALVLVDKFSYDKPRTALLVAALERIGVADKKVLILSDGVNRTLFLSARNLPNVRVLPYTDASTYALLWSDVVVIESRAIGATLAPIAEKADGLKPTRRRASRAGGADADAPEGEAAAAGTKKRAAKKSAGGAARKTAGKSAASKTARKKPAAKSAAKSASKSKSKSAAKAPAKAPAKKASAPKKKGK